MAMTKSPPIYNRGTRSGKKQPGSPPILDNPPQPTPIGVAQEAPPVGKPGILGPPVQGKPGAGGGVGMGIGAGPIGGSGPIVANSGPGGIKVGHGRPMGPPEQAPPSRAIPTSGNPDAQAFYEQWKARRMPQGPPSGPIMGGGQPTPAPDGRMGGKPQQPQQTTWPGQMTGGKPQQRQPIDWTKVGRNTGPLSPQDQAKRQSQLASMSPEEMKRYQNYLGTMRGGPRTMEDRNAGMNVGHMGLWGNRQQAPPGIDGGGMQPAPDGQHWARGQNGPELRPTPPSDGLMRVQLQPYQIPPGGMNRPDQPYTNPGMQRPFDNMQGAESFESIQVPFNPNNGMQAHIGPQGPPQSSSGPAQYTPMPGGNGGGMAYNHPQGPPQQGPQPSLPNQGVQGGGGGQGRFRPWQDIGMSRRDFQQLPPEMRQQMRNNNGQMMISPGTGIQGDFGELQQSTIDMYNRMSQPGSGFGQPQGGFDPQAVLQSLQGQYGNFGMGPQFPNQ